MAFPSELREWREIRWETPDRAIVTDFIANIISEETAHGKLLNLALEVNQLEMLCSQENNDEGLTVPNIREWRSIVLMAQAAIERAEGEK